MAKLILSLGNSLLGEVVLVKETTTIGRNKDNDILIENLSSSGHHARVVNADGKFTVEDLGSTNGTLVNGQKVERKSLEDDDVITIGKHELRFVGEVERAGKPSDFEKTVFVRMPSAAAAHLSPPPPQGRTQSLPSSITVDLDPPAPTGNGRLIKILAAVVVVLAVAVVAYLRMKVGR
ncbi:hypothetical protein CCP3SC1_20069 [Gammaproteobacteria bacterium]